MGVRRVVTGHDAEGMAIVILEAGDIVVQNGTRTVADHLVGAGVNLQDQGEQELKGVPGTWRLYRAVP